MVTIRPTISVVVFLYGSIRDYERLEQLNPHEEDGVEYVLPYKPVQLQIPVIISETYSLSHKEWSLAHDVTYYPNLDGEQQNRQHHERLIIVPWGVHDSALQVALLER